MMLWILVLSVLLIVILLVVGVMVAHSRIDEIIQDMGQILNYPISGQGFINHDNYRYDRQVGSAFMPEDARMGASGIGEAMAKFGLPENWEELLKEERREITDWEMNGDDLG